MTQQTLPSNEDRPASGTMGRSDRDIAELNLAWLLKARELAKTDRAKATVLFGVDQGLSDVLVSASIQDLRNLAQSGLMLFRPRFHVRFWRRGCAGVAPSSPGLALQSLMLAAEEVVAQ